MIRAIIVEDSRLARLELTSQLADIKLVSLVGEARNLAEAKTLVSQEKPDLIFLDINLPDGNGFDLLAALEYAPKVIFTTAFDEFALKAFEQNAVDYLLKPYTQQRLVQAIERLSINEQHDEPAMRKGSQPMTLDSRFFVKDGGQCWLITLAQVERFEALGNYTQVYFEQNKTVVYRTLAQIEDRLPKESFFRANRSHIVQLSQVNSVELCSSGGLELTMRSGSKVEVSRRQSTLFKNLLAL
ncbi:LytR/AlgR family response regulator transcription factor [Thalassotalea fusca]